MLYSTREEGVSVAASEQTTLFDHAYGDIINEHNLRTPSRAK